MITYETLRAAVAGCVGIAPEDIPGDANLILLGITSMNLMKLVNGWRRDGLAVAFADMVREPTLDGWWRHLDRLQNLRVNAS